ncbi:MAG: hypothetical protein R3A13_07415 [Bdellovibrionota bacterium]
MGLFNRASTDRVTEVAASLDGKTIKAPERTTRGLTVGTMFLAMLASYGPAALKVGTTVAGATALAACGGGGTTNVRTPAVTNKTPEEIEAHFNLALNPYGYIAVDTGPTKKVEVSMALGDVNVEDFVPSKQTTEFPYSVSSVIFKGSSSQGGPEMLQIISTKGNVEVVLFESDTSPGAENAVAYRRGNQLIIDRTKLNDLYGIDSATTPTKVRVRADLNLRHDQTGEIVTLNGPSALLEITPATVMTKVMLVGYIDRETGIEVPGGFELDRETNELVRVGPSSSEAVEMPANDGRVQVSVRVLTPEENAAYDQEVAEKFPETSSKQ